jgi:hypothetical protein
MNNEEIESFMRIQGLVIREILVLVKQQSLSCRDYCTFPQFKIDDFPHTGAQNYGAIRNRNTFLQQL